MWRDFKRWVVRIFYCRFRDSHSFSACDVVERAKCPDSECALQQGVITATTCCKRRMFIHIPWEQLEGLQDCCPNHGN